MLTLASQRWVSYQKRDVESLKLTSRAESWLALALAPVAAAATAFRAWIAFCQRTRASPCHEAFWLLCLLRIPVRA
eukprot:4026902-Pleurochrysis_carterae.AAC.1